MIWGDSPGHVNLPVMWPPGHLVEGHLEAHGQSQREGEHASDHIRRVALLLHGVEGRAGPPAGGRGGRDVRVGPVGCVVIGTGVLVQPVARVLAAKAVVAGAAAVDEGAPGAVEGNV